MQAVSQTEIAHSWLRNQLLDGHLKPGAKLKIDSLRERGGVSVAAIREALSRLTAEGLVKAIPQRGFIVAPISRADLKDLTAVRIEIETKCLRQSIENGDLAWEGRLLSVWHQLEKTNVLLDDGASGFNSKWIELHNEFHDALISHCGSEWWLRLRGQLYAQVERYRRLLLPFAKSPRNPEEEHRGIVEAALARNADLACDLLAKHLQRTADALLESDAPFEDSDSHVADSKTNQ